LVFLDLPEFFAGVPEFLLAKGGKRSGANIFEKSSSWAIILSEFCGILSERSGFAIRAGGRLKISEYP
jgi:hypothetical protein